MRILVSISFILLLSFPLRAQTGKSVGDTSKTKFVAVDEAPQPTVPLEKLIHYPEYARRHGIEGIVVMQVLIEKDGSVITAEVLKSTDTSLAHEALRVMKEVRFTPAMVHGQPQRTWVTRTITFRLH